MILNAIKAAASSATTKFKISHFLVFISIGFSILQLLASAGFDDSDPFLILTPPSLLWRPFNLIFTNFLILWENLVRDAVVLFGCFLMVWSFDSCRFWRMFRPITLKEIGGKCLFSSLALWLFSELIKHFLIVSVCTNALCCILFIIMFALSGNADYLSTRIYGMGSFACSLIVAYKRVRF